jgi:alpha-methylacyl-CoA racemase
MVLTGFMTPSREGPLTGVRVIELAGIGPGPLAAMVLADLGADVIRIDRPQGTAHSLTPEKDFLNRSRPNVGVDLKSPQGVALAQRLIDAADVLIEGFRPGVVERMGIGPEECLARNPRLVFARMTGWGQDGPLAHSAGHDINYLSLTGALHAIGEPGRGPVPPLNLVADFGGGTMFLLLGILSALVERESSGRGQVVDTAMVDGASTLMAMTYMYYGSDMWTNDRGSNLLDGGAPYYTTYECADGRHVAVGALEAKFFATLVAMLGITDVSAQGPVEDWPRMRARFAEVFKTKTRDEWAEIFAGTDACVTPILDLTEAPAGEHLAARRTFVTEAGMAQPTPAPRFSRTPGRIQSPPGVVGHQVHETLGAWGVTADEVDALVEAKIVTG